MINMSQTYSIMNCHLSLSRHNFNNPVSLIFVFFSIFILVSLCACKQKEKPDPIRKLVITDDFPIPVICDDSFLEAEKLSTPMEYIAQYGNLEPENDWFLHPEQFKFGALTYWSKYMAGKENAGWPSILSQMGTNIHLMGGKLNYRK